MMISFCFAFTNISNDGLKVTYGVSENDPSQIELKLNEDYTFSYQNFSITTQKIKVKGSYQVKNNKILLLSEQEGIRYPDQWEISKDLKTAKARMGLTFYTLHKK